MTTRELLNRLKHLSDSNKELVLRISKLSKLTSADDSTAQLAESREDVAEDIHASLKELEAEFEIFKQGAEDAIGASSGSQRRRDVEKEKDRVLLITQIERFGEDLKASRGHFRRAQLQAKKNEEEALKKRAREQLFATAAATGQDGSRSPAGKRRGPSDNQTRDDVLVNAAGDVTAGLRRTHQLMTQELERSRFAHETLQKSTAALNSLNESYSGLDDLLKSSRSLLSTLVSSQKSDTWYLETALKIAVATIIWLIFRRWFYGPLLYLVYKPSRFMLGAVYSVLNLTLGILTGTIFKLGDRNSNSGIAASSASRTPLKVLPSASGGIPKRRAGQQAPRVKVGLGGGGAREEAYEERHKEGDNFHQQVAEMAEDSKKQENQYQGGVPSNDEGAAGGSSGTAGSDAGAKGGPITTGDGTVLRDRTAAEPVNPKKRMMEVPLEPLNAEGDSTGNKDEL